MLQIDEQYRGRNAIHLKWHHKLGLHRTLIRGALPLAQYLVDHPQVDVLALGRCLNVQASGTGWGLLRVEVYQETGLLELVVTDGKAIQWLTIRLCGGVSAFDLQIEINARFANSPGGA